LAAAFRRGASCSQAEQSYLIGTMATQTHPVRSEPESSALLVAHVVYALHALSLGIGALTAASVVGTFVLGWPSVIAVVLNYVMRGSAEGTWLESHFRWQIRTFWYAALWAALVVLVSIPLALVLVGFATYAVGLFVLGIWASVRIIKGWLRLKNGEPITF
jgi:uncharacterized membrane protein